MCVCVYLTTGVCVHVPISEACVPIYRCVGLIVILTRLLLTNRAAMYESIDVHYMG
jgi:hypothetical protein